jgi:hypothetical protein
LQCARTAKRHSSRLLVPSYPVLIALQLAELYKISHWVRALLDPSPIEKVAGDAKKNITSPPQYLHLDDHSIFAPPAVTQNATRRGGLRSGSPARTTQPPKKAASSPRKRAASKQAAASTNNGNKSDDAQPATAQQPSQAGSDDVSSLPAAVAVAAADHVKSKTATTVNEDNIHVDVDSVVRTNGELETTYTNVRVDLPLDLPPMPAPERPEDMVARAKEMVAEAQKLIGSGGAASSGKRKFDELAADDDSDDGDDDEEDGDSENEDDRGGEVSRYAGSRPVKRIRLLEEELQKERVRNRALVGLTFTFAFGYVFLA